MRRQSKITTTQDISPWEGCTWSLWFPQLLNKSEL